MNLTDMSFSTKLSFPSVRRLAKDTISVREHCPLLQQNKFWFQLFWWFYCSDNTANLSLTKCYVDLNLCCPIFCAKEVYFTILIPFRNTCICASCHHVLKRVINWGSLIKYILKEDCNQRNCALGNHCEKYLI